MAIVRADSSAQAATLFRKQKTPERAPSDALLKEQFIVSSGHMGSSQMWCFALRVFSLFVGSLPPLAYAACGPSSWHGEGGNLFAGDNGHAESRKLHAIQWAAK